MARDLSSRGLEADVEDARVRLAAALERAAPVAAPEIELVDEGDAARRQGEGQAARRAQLG